MTNWKSATCEACAYRVNEACRRFPQYKQVEFSIGYYDTSSTVASIDRAYSEACAEYTEEGQPTPFERAAKLAVDKGAVAAMQAVTDSLR